MVPRLEPAGRRIVDDLRPDLVAFPDGDGVEVRGGLVRAGGGVGAAHDRREAVPAAGGGDLIGPSCAAAVPGHPHEVVAPLRQQCLRRGGSEDLVDELDLVAGGDELRQHLQPELRDEAAERVVPLRPAADRVD